MCYDKNVHKFLLITLLGGYYDKKKNSYSSGALPWRDNSFHGLRRILGQLLAARGRPGKGR
jgi:hypothetical protein